MKLISQFAVRHKGKILITILLVVIFIVVPMFSRKNYGILLDADILRIYSNNTLIATVDNPGYLVDVYNGSIGVGWIDTSSLGISRINMTEIYRLEFVKDGKIITNIKVLTPRNQEAIYRIEQRNIKNVWRELDGHYVVMTENFHYFSFGSDFFENLSKVLNQS